VEANADTVKTDIAVDFATPAAGSANTGLIAAGSFNVYAYEAPSGGGGGGGSVPVFSVRLNVPRGGETYVPGQQVGISWSPDRRQLCELSRLILRRRRQNMERPWHRPRHFIYMDRPRDLDRQRAYQS